jgi:hypothetical protein
VQIAETALWLSLQYVNVHFIDIRLLLTFGRRLCIGFDTAENRRLRVTHDINSPPRHHHSYHGISLLDISHSLD